MSAQIAEWTILINDPLVSSPLGEQVFQLMSGFPYGTTAQYEDVASTTPVNFSLT